MEDTVFGMNWVDFGCFLLFSTLQTKKNVVKRNLLYFSLEMFVFTTKTLLGWQTKQNKKGKTLVGFDLAKFNESKRGPGQPPKEKKKVCISKTHSVRAARSSFGNPEKKELKRKRKPFFQSETF